MEFRSVMNQKKKSEMVIFLMWAHLPLERLGRYTMLTAQKIALTASSVAHYEVFIFSCSLEMNTSEIGHSAYFYFSEVTILWIPVGLPDVGTPSELKHKCTWQTISMLQNHSFPQSKYIPQNRRCGHCRDITCFNKINDFCINMSK